MAKNLRDRGYGSSMDDYNAHKRKVEERKEQEKTTGPVSTLRLPKVNSTASGRAASTSAPIQTQRFYDPNVTRATPGTGGGRGTPHITEQEFNRSTAMTRSYGNYNNYLNGIHVTGSGFADPDQLFSNEPDLKAVETAQDQFDHAMSVVSGNFEQKASAYERWYKTITNQYQPMSDAQKAQGDQLYADYMKSLDAYQKMSDAHMKASASNAGVYADVSNRRRQWYDSIRDEKDIDVEEKDLMSQLDLLEDQKYKVQSESSYAKTQTLHGITTAQGLETVMNSTDELDRLDRQIDEVKAQLELLNKERAYSRYFKWQELANNNMPVSARRMQGGAPSWLDKIISGTATEEEIMQAINEGNINPSNIAEMLDDEKQTYRAIYEQYGPAKAKEYVDELERYGNIRDSLNTRRRMTDEAKLRNWVQKGSPFGRQFAASVLTVLASPTKAFSYVGQGADYLFSGEMTKDADYNVFSYAPNAVTAQIGENITKWGGEHGLKWVEKWGEFGYQTALSMATFLYTTALTGGLGLSQETMYGVELYNQGYRTAEAVSAYKAFKTAETLSLGLMGTEAAADAVMQAKDRGLDDGQAFWMGTAAGAIEILTEKFSVENLLEGVGDRNRLLYFLKSMFTEGSEEVASDFSNMLVDSLVARDKSEFNQAVKTYMKEYGVSKQEALKAVWTDQLKSVGLSGLGGAISGGFMGGGNIVRSNVSNLFNRSAITSPENVANIVNRAQGLNEWSAGARSASSLQKKLDAGERLTIREVLKARNAIETDRKTDPKYVGALIEAAQDYGDSDAKKQADKLQANLDNGKVKVEDVEKLEEAIDLERLVDPNREDLQSALKYGETADQKSEAYKLTKGVRDKIAAGERLSLEEVSAAESAVNTAKATSAEGLKSTIESGLASDQNSPAYKSAQQLQSKLDNGTEITLAEVNEAKRAVRAAENAAFKSLDPNVVGKYLVTENGRKALTDAATILTNSTAQSDVQRGNQILQAIKDGNLDAKTAGEAFLRSQKILENTEKQTARVLQPREVTADMDAYDRSAAKLGVSVEEATHNKAIMQAFGVEGEYKSFENNNLSAYYDRSTGKVYINANAQNPGLALIAHEVTHSFENTAGYKKLANLVFSQSKDLNADLQRITQEYKDAGIDLDDDGARSELVSEFVEQHMFNDEKFINDVVTTDRSLGQKVLRAIDNLLAKLGNKDAQQRKLLRDARDLWAKALQQRKTSDAAKAKIAEKRSEAKKLTLPTAKAAAVRKTEGPNLPKAESKQYAIGDRAVYIKDGTDANGNIVSFTDLILDGKKLGETRNTKNLPVGEWVGITKGGKNPSVVGRVIFGDPIRITNQSPEYASAYIDGTNYGLKNGESKWYYPIVQVEDFRDNPRKMTSNAPVMGRYQYATDDSQKGLSLPVAQAVSSAKTSIKQVPALFTDSRVKFGKVNIDIGGGKYDLASDYLKERGTKNLLFDPYNRDRATNRATLQYLQDGNRADTATCANVLNVIAEPDARSNVILETAKAIKPDGTAYFMVYEGDGSGNGKRTSAGWQNNMKTADYVSEIEQYFDNVERRGKLIVASSPKADLPQASWEVQPGEAIRYAINKDATLKENTKKEDIKPVAESKAISARNWINQQIMSAFGIKTNKTETSKIIQKYADKAIAEGAVTDEDVSELFYELYDKGAIDVFPDEYSQTMRDLVMGGQIFADPSVKADFGDDWNLLRRRAFAAGLLITNTSPNESAKSRGIDMIYHEASEMAPGTFPPSVTDPRQQLETIVKAAEDGQKMKMTLGEYLAYMDKTEGQDMYEAAQKVMDRMAQDFRTFGEMAGLELKLRDRTGRAIAKERERFGEIREKHFTTVSEARQQERARFREAQRYQREQRQLRELQEKTMKQLKWMRKNQYRAPADMASEWADLVADMDMYAINVARETQYSKSLGMTYGDAKAMYDELVQADNNFTPSAELDRIMTRLTSGHIGDMDIDALQDYYNALTSLRHEFYQRNNAILGDELEAFSDIYSDTKANMKAQKGKMRGIWDIDFMTPVNVLKKMVGWNQSSRWIDMVNDLERGERKIRDFTVRANRLLDDYKKKNAKWLATADGQGKNGQWIEVQVPVYDWLDGEAFATGEMQTVYITPLQRVHLYLESKGHANMNHIAGGRTFADKDLYSQGKRANAFAKGTTVSMNEATVKRILQDMSQEELELAKILEKFYNEFSRPYINETSQKLWGYNKAMDGYYAPIISNRNFTHQELGIGDTTAKGVGNMKLRQPHAKNASVNISALEAFDRSVQQTARFYGMGTVERNWNMLLNWQSGGSSMRDVISNAWTGKENAVDYIENLIREMQGNIDREDPSRLDKFGNRLLSNYVGATFGANPGITLKQAASFPTFATVLEWKNMPSPAHIAKAETKAYEDLINTYTSELAYRTMGYASPETAQLVNNPGLIQRNKAMNFLFGGGMIIAMDAATVKSGWAWAENYVDSHYNLEKGTQEQIDSGKSPYYKKVAEVFEDAVATTQPMYDIMHRAGIMRKSGTFTRAFTMFRTVPMQMYNSLRRSYGEFDAAKQQYQNDRTAANKTAMNKAANRAAASTAAIVVSNLALEAIEFLNALWKNRGKKYRDDDDELTALSVAKEIGLKLIPDTAMVPVLKELTEMFEAKLLGRKWYGISLPGGEQLNDLVDTIGGSFDTITDFINGAIDVQKNGEDLGLYFKRHGREYAGALKDTVEKLGKYLGGLPLENLEKYIMGAVQFSPELTQAVEDAFKNPAKNNLKGKTGKALEKGITDYFDIRGIKVSSDAAQAIGSLYEAGYGDAVPPAGPTKLKIIGSDVELSEAQTQEWERTWASKANVNEMIASPEFQNADDATKEKLLKKLYDYARIETNKDITDNFWTTDDKWPDKVTEYVNSGHTLPEAIYGQVTGNLDKLLKGETPESIAAAAEAKAEKEAAEARYESQTFTFKGEDMAYDELSGRQKKIVQAKDAVTSDPNADLSDIIGANNATKQLGYYQAARNAGISNETYIMALEAIDNADNGDGNYTQKNEVNVALGQLVEDGKLTEKEAGKIWKCFFPSSEKNPFPVGAIISRPMGLRLPKIG